LTTLPIYATVFRTDNIFSVKRGQGFFDKNLP
jgi:hypothetical protein